MKPSIERQQSFSPVTYLLLLVYTVIILGSVYLLLTDDYSQMLSMSYEELDLAETQLDEGRVSLTAYMALYLAMMTSLSESTDAMGTRHSDPLAETRMHLKMVRPALTEMRKKLSDNPLRNVTFAAIIFVITWLVMRVAMRRLLDHLVSRFNLDSNSRFGYIAMLLGIDSTKGGLYNVGRIIDYDNGDDCEVSDLEDEEEEEEHAASDNTQSTQSTQFKVYSILTRKDGTKKRKKVDKATNYVSSTVFDSSSPLVVVVLSFFYGGAVYLSQKMQVWCLAVAFVQLISFNTGKSFWPLIIFTVFIAITFAVKEMESWKADQKQNAHMIRLATGRDSKDIPSSVLPKAHFSQRGKLRPGNRIEIRVGEQVPADMIIVGSRVSGEKQPSRMLFYMNEVQVTGENTPVRKFPFSCPDGSAIRRLEINEMDTYEATVNGKYLINQHSIAFLSSTLESELKDLVVIGIVAWVGTETKALNSAASAGKIKSRYRMATPFDDYAGMGFGISVVVLLVVTLFNSFVAYYQNDEQVHNVNFGTVFVSHLMYINMIVPQALEQCRVWVCSVLSTKFRAEIKGCNKSSGIDVLGFIDRIVSDKTGTLTQNKMVARVSMVFKDALPNDLAHIPSPLLMFNQEDNGQIEDNDTQRHRDFYAYPESQNEFGNNALAIFATTGTEPEEQAIRRNISAYATLSSFEPPDPSDRNIGHVTFRKRAQGTDKHLVIHVNFGFWRPLLCKAAMFEDSETGNCYMAVQAGGDEFWHMGRKIRTSVLAKLEIWDEKEKNFQVYPGAPRAWSHGLKPIGREEMERYKSKWYESLDIEDSKKRSAEQLEIVRSALEDIELVSKTFMIDEYRTYVDIAIKQLVKAGKQIFMCTGDSRSAAETIAMQLRFSPNCIDIFGENERELLESVKEAARLASDTSSTFFVDQQCMELLQQIEMREGGFFGEVFDLFLSLLSRRQPEKPDRFMHYAVFCRATPGLKPFVVRMLQYRYPENFFDGLNKKRHHVLAVGDGANDVNMFSVADASLGIMSGETKDVCDRATLWSTEWYPIVRLLLEDGPEKTTLLATMVKMVFMKHWLTAFALWADLLFRGFTLMPLEPTNPMMMLLFNAVIFMQIATHAARDELNSSKLRNAKLMSVRAFVRWIFSAGIAGFAVCWAVRYLFPSATDDQFGMLILVGQAMVVTINVLLSTNAWSNSSATQSESIPATPADEEDALLNEIKVRPSLAKSRSSSSLRYIKLKPLSEESSEEVERNAAWTVVIGILSMLGSLAAAAYYTRMMEDDVMRCMGVVAILITGIYPAIGFYSMLNRDMRFLFQLKELTRMSPSDVLDALVAFTHTKHGRVLPILLFLFAIKLVSGIALIAFVCVAVLVALVSVVIFLVVVSRIGFMRALLDGRAAAVAIIFFCLGAYVGSTHWCSPHVQ